MELVRKWILVLLSNPAKSKWITYISLNVALEKGDYLSSIGRVLHSWPGGYRFESHQSPWTWFCVFEQGTLSAVLIIGTTQENVWT